MPTKRDVVLWIMYWIVISTTTIAAIGVWSLVAESEKLESTYNEFVTNMSIEYCAIYFNRQWNINNSAIVEVVGMPDFNHTVFTDPESDFFAPFGDIRLIGKPESYIQYLEKYYKKYGYDRYDWITGPDINITSQT